MSGRVKRNGRECAARSNTPAFARRLRGYGPERTDQNEKETTTVDSSEKATALAKKVIDFYWPIFEKASEKGWVKG